MMDAEWNEVGCDNINIQAAREMLKCLEDQVDDLIEVIEVLNYYIENPDGLREEYC